MHPHNQIDTFLAFYRERRYPDTFVSTLERYLQGEVPLAEVQQQYDQVPLRRREPYR